MGGLSAIERRGCREVFATLAGRTSLKWRGNLRRVRQVVVVALLALGCACGGPKASSPTSSSVPAAAKEYSAARWIPAKPTYAIAARTVRDAQRAITDAVESFGLLADVELAQVSSALRGLLIVDVMSPDALRSIGIDLDGGFAVFSDAVDPTLVVHLSSPDQTRAWLDDQRSRGSTTTTSQLVGDVEVFGTKISKSFHIHWAIDRDWMWIHFTFGKPGGTEWFTASRNPGPPAWTADWEWARQRGDKPALIGFVDLRKLLGKLAPKINDNFTCIEPLSSISRAGFAIEGSPKHAALRFAIDIGALAPALQKAILPAPEGWDAAAASAPIAAQWNLDLAAVKTWLAPCGRGFSRELEVFARYGVRSGRLFVSTFDPASKEGSGAGAFDLSSKRFFQSLLDEIPLRSTLESKKQFGPHSGRRLAVPLLPAVEYVLTDSLALAAFGDGLLTRIVGAGGPANSPILSVDIKPAGLSTEAWAFLLQRMKIFDNPTRVAERLVAWRDGHLAIRLEGSRLVFEARGTRP